MSQGRIWAIVLVALLHALLGYAFVTGLAYKFVKNVQEDLKTFDVEEPPPPEEEPPPPPEQPQTEPPPFVPPSIVRVQTPPPPPMQQTQIPIPRDFNPLPLPPAPVPPPPPPPPPPVRVQEPVSARGDLRRLFSQDDYPPAAQRNGETGTVRARLTVDTNGRVTNCSVTSSSGSSSLDSTTCRILRSRARFQPARDNRGNATTGTVNTPPITWRLEDE